jgi:predicted nucleotidyltransferase component of viral defense system
MGQSLQIHESPDAFRQALSFTEAETGFVQRLIEKDYYCSLILADFEPLFAGSLVFKGGTSLSKVHADFCRLSEDIDFAISIATAASRRDRRDAIAPVRKHLEQIGERLTIVNTSVPLKGNDNCRQYNAVLQYESAVTGESETVKVEVAIREPIIESTVSCAGRTLLRHPVPEQVPDAELSLCVLSLHETYAEKVRAALTRNTPAIRDIFDIDNAVRTKRLDFSDPGFLKLVQQKLAVPRNAPIDASHARRQLLEDQLETDLKPVLRSSDYAAFDIKRAFEEVEKLAAMLHGE